MRGDSERLLPGNAATVQADLPFSGLSHFGTSFLSKFNVSFTNAPLCEYLTLIDTPGVLSGDKQRLGRSYDFVKTVEWFAQRSDMILLLFDAHKLDISDDQRIRIEIANYEFLLANLKSENTPKSASNLLMIISALMKALFMNQYLKSNRKEYY